MDNQQSTNISSIKDKIFKVNSLFLSCYGDKEGKYIFDIFYLNKNGEFIDIELSKKLIKNDRRLNKDDYKKHLIINDNYKYIDYLKEKEDCDKDDYDKFDEKYMLNSLCNIYKINIDENKYYLKEYDSPKDANDKDFCIAPLFILYEFKYKTISTEFGWPFYNLAPSNVLSEKTKNFLNSIKLEDNKISYKDIIRTKNFLDNISKQHHDYNIEENEF